MARLRSRKRTPLNPKLDRNIDYAFRTGSLKPPATGTHRPSRQNLSQSVINHAQHVKPAHHCPATQAPRPWNSSEAPTKRCIIDISIHQRPQTRQIGSICIFCTAIVARVPCATAPLSGTQTHPSHQTTRIPATTPGITQSCTAPHAIAPSNHTAGKCISTPFVYLRATSTPHRTTPTEPHRAKRGTRLGRDAKSGVGATPPPPPHNQGATAPRAREVSSDWS